MRGDGAVGRETRHLPRAATAGENTGGKWRTGGRTGAGCGKRRLEILVSHEFVRYRDPADGMEGLHLLGAGAADQREGSGLDISRELGGCGATETDSLACIISWSSSISCSNKCCSSSLSRAVSVAGRGCCCTCDVCCCLPSIVFCCPAGMGCVGIPNPGGAPPQLSADARNELDGWERLGKGYLSQELMASQPAS